MNSYSFIKLYIHRIHNAIRDRKTAITYTTGSLFNSFAQLISGIIILAYVGPEEIGLWNSLILFQTYSLFLESGIINGLNRELPFSLGKGDTRHANILASTALFYTFFSIFICLLLGLILILVKSDNSVLFYHTFIGVLIITLTKFYEDYLTSTFRSNQAFEKLAAAYFYRGIFLLVSILIVVKWGYYGYIIRMILTSVLFVLLLHKIRPIKVKAVFNFSAFKLLLRVGLPIFALAYIFTISGTFDRVLLIKKTSVAVVGLYSLALMAYNGFKTFPVSLANYIYPKMSFQYGTNNNPNELSTKAIKINILVLIIMLPLAIAGYFLLPSIIPQLFPKYIGGIKAAQVLLFAAVFSGASIGVNVIWSMKIWKYIYFHQIGGALINVIFIYLGFRVLEAPLIGISVGVLLGQFLNMLFSNYFIYKLQ